jgi:dienelactone hydrolase
MSLPPDAVRRSGPDFTDDRVRSQLRERPFEVDRDGRRIPGVLWTPLPGPAGAEAVPGTRPLVLIGHGGSGSKYQSSVVATARGLAHRYGIATAAVDGPIHGDRRADRDPPPGLVLMEFAQLWANDGDAMTDAMVADWRAVLDALTALPDFVGSPVGWWGVSLGTILGLPLVAAEPRISAAVLGLMGLTGPTRQRIARDAPAVRCPVLFLVQWADELFARDDSLALYDALGTVDKRLHAHPGGHGQLPDEAFVNSGHFLADRLSTPRITAG